MSDWLMAVLIGVGIGAILGVGIARYSLAKLAIRGGILAQVFHYLACALLVSSTPFIIAAIVVGVPFLMMFGTAIGFIAVAAIMTLAYAFVEHQTQVT